MVGLDNIARFIGLLISLFGMSVFIKRRAGIAYAFCMSIACSFIVSILFFFSLFMKITVVIWVLAIAGLVLFVIELIRREIHSEDVLNWTNLFLLVGTVVLFLFLSGRRFIFIDDFTHWAVMARSVFEHQGLPTAADPLITFTSYVPGTALWNCYVVTLVGGRTEDVYLIAQAFLILVYFTPFMGISRMDRRGETAGKASRGEILMQGGMVLLTMVLCAVTMSFSTSILSLCVDGVLAAAAVGGIAFVVMSDADLPSKIWFSIPLMLALMLFKTAGILYVFMIFLILIYFCIREKRQGKHRPLTVFGMIAAPVICMLAELFWQWHVKVAFPDNAASMHSLSIARWREIFASRSEEMIHAILKEFFRKITLWYLVLFVLALIVIYVFIYICGRKAGHKIARQSLWLLLLSLLNYVIYLGGMLFVYLFSMEEVNAPSIAAFDRYMWVELIYLSGICMGFVFRIFRDYEVGFSPTSPEGDEKPYGLRAFAIKHGTAIRLIPLIVADVIAVAALILFWKYAPHYDIKYEGSTIEQINELKPESYYGDVLFYAPSVMDGAYDESLLLYFGKYRFRSTAVSDATFDRGNVESQMGVYSHLYIYETDDQLISYLRSIGWSGEITPGLYDIEAKAPEKCE